MRVKCVHIVISTVWSNWNGIQQTTRYIENYSIAKYQPQNDIQSTVTDTYDTGCDTLLCYLIFNGFNEFERAAVLSQ